MNRYLFLLPVTLLLSCGQQNPTSQTSTKVMTASMQQSSPLPQTAEPFAIVELFTSEGCSSCPSAERVLNDITHKAMADKSYIYPLAFHVDYWNKLGWRDVFSNGSYSDRQRSYREALGARVVYTPQMIVNGKREFVGSDQGEANAAIEEALESTPPVYFSIEPNKTWSELAYDMVDLTDPIRDKAKQYDFCVAIVERGLVTEVKRGENRDRTLSHENVVRKFKTYPFNTSGETIQIPTLDGGQVPNENHSIIAFVQHRETMEIVGANLWNY